jgi:hypothetical protein
MLDILTDRHMFSTGPSHPHVAYSFTFDDIDLDFDVATDDIFRDIIKYESKLLK